MKGLDGLKYADENIGRLAYDGVLDTLKELYEGHGRKSGDIEIHQKTLSFMKNDWDLLETMPDPLQPGDTVYGLSEKGEKLYEITDRYKDEIGGFEDLLDSFHGKETTGWTRLIGTVEQSDMLDDMNWTGSYSLIQGYLEEAEELDLVVTGKETVEGINKTYVDEVTDKGKTAQQYVREIAEKFSDEVSGEASTAQGL